MFFFLPFSPTPSFPPYIQFLVFKLLATFSQYKTLAYSPPEVFFLWHIKLDHELTFAAMESRQIFLNKKKSARLFLLTIHCPPATYDTNYPGSEGRLTKKT